MAVNRTGKRGRKQYRAGRVQPREEMHLMAPFRDKEGEGVFSSPPLAHTLTTLIGCVVEVQMRAGEVFEGVLEAVSPNMDITLRVAHVKGESPTRETVQDRKEVNFSDVVTISATTGSNPQLGNIFKTDNEISSRSNGPQSRELQPFTDFNNEDSPDLTLSSSKESGWSVEDMWDVNQTKFNVSSKFDEEMSQYTTQLDRTDSDAFKERELRAKKLAGEIEGGDMFSRHGIDDSGTEEERFSAVSRATATSKSDRPLTNQIISAAQENIRHPTTAISPLPSSTPPHSLPITTPTLSTSARGGTGTVGSGNRGNGNHGDGNCGNGDHSSLPLMVDVRKDTTNGVDSSEGAVRTNGGENPLIMDTKQVESPSSLSEAAMDPSTGEKVQTPVGTEQEQPTEQGTKVAEKAEGEEEEEGGGSRENQIKEPSKTEKEIAIKEFKLDPKAKEFVLDPTANTFVPSSVPVSRTSPSPSSVHTSPSSSTSTHYPHTPSHTQPHNRSSRFSGHKSPRNNRGHTPTQVYTSPAVFPEHMFQAAVSSGYVLAQQQAASGIFRPGMLQQGFQQYAVPPNHMVAGMMVHGGMPNPQIIAANPHTQMMGGQQLFNMTPQQTQFLAQPGQQIFTPQGMISTAQGGLYLPGVTPHTPHSQHTPHSSLQQQQALVAAAAVLPQAAPSMGQQIVATAVPSSLPQRMFQIPGAGK